MSEQSEYSAGKRMAIGALCACTAFFLSLVVMPSTPCDGLDPSDAVRPEGIKHVGFNGYQIQVNGKYTALNMTQPFTEIPAVDGLDKKALDEMAGKGYERSYSSDPLQEAADSMMFLGDKKTGRVGGKKSDGNVSMFGISGERRESEGWLVSKFNEYDDGEAAGADKSRSSIYDLDRQNRGGLIGGQRREGGSLYGDKESDGKEPDTH
jgi:hypothetical protein